MLVLVVIPQTRSTNATGLALQRNIGLRDWSLITGRRGGLQNGSGGACEVLPLRKGGAEKVVAMLKRGTHVWEFLCGSLKF